MDIVLSRTVEWETEDTYTIGTLIEHRPLITTYATSGSTNLSYKKEHLRKNAGGSGIDKLIGTATNSATYKFDSATNYISYLNAKKEFTADTGVSFPSSTIGSSEWGGSLFNKKSIKVYLDYTFKVSNGLEQNFNIWINCDADVKTNSGG